MADPIIGQISVGDGATFTPAVDSDGVISWTNNKNLPNPASVDIPQAVVDRYQLAPIASPAFTGTPTAPTPTAGDDSTNIATTAFVQAELDDYLALAGGTMTGEIAWTQGEIGYRDTTHTEPADVCKQIIVTAGAVDSVWNDGNAKLALHTYDTTQTNTAENGAFVLQASDGTHYKELQGKPDGTLTWNGNNVITPPLLPGIAFSLGDDNVPTIPANSNLNNYTTTGTYRSTSSATSSTLSNCPVSNSAFKLFVIEIGYGAFGSYGMQLILGIGRAIYVRNKTSGGGWTAWGKISYTDA